MIGFRWLAVPLVVALVAAGTAQAHPLHHRAWTKLDTKQRVATLKRQIGHDLGVLSFFRQNPRIVADVSFIAHRQIRWHRVSLRIARRSLKRLERVASSSGPVPWYWEMLHECEQPGSWTNGGSDSTFSGGLGIHRDVWGSIASRLGLPSWAGAAAPWQQIAVARVIMRDYGASAWAGCAPKAQAVMNQEHIS